MDTVKDNHNLDRKEPQNLVEHLQFVIRGYLDHRPHMSINSLSKKCSVSEPTLRRISKGQVKTLPNITTVLDILSYIANEQSVCKLEEIYPGPIADFLKESMPQASECQSEYSIKLNEELKDPTKYLIYKLAANTLGVRVDKVKELFGSYGVSLLFELIEKEYIVENVGVCKTTSESFTSSHEKFVDKFKVVSDFIKTQKVNSKKGLNPLFANYSNSVSPKAYKDIVSIQKRSLKKIREIMSNDDNVGQIPLFLLAAIDTLDEKAAYEIKDNQ